MDEFPIDQIRFKGLQGVVSGARPLHRRILGRPPIPPDRKEGWQVVCPNDKCAKILPLSTGSEQSLVIGLVGAQESGKTNYVGALIKQLNEDAGRRFGAGLLPLDTATSDRFATEFELGMFRNHLPPRGTIRTPPPLMYNLIFNGDLWGEKEPRSVTLALYDTAGENFENEDRVRELVGYLRIAAGVVFIVDPMQSAGVRELLAPANIPLPNLKPSNSPAALISRVLTELEGRAILEGSKQFPTPVAFTMTKCDELMRAGVIDPNSRWAGQEVHEGYFDTSLQTGLESSIREVFQRYEPGAYQNIRNRFTNHAFFGVSSTGSSPDPVTGRYPSVAPKRVEEPLLWLLSHIGVIPARRTSGR